MTDRNNQSKVFFTKDNMQLIVNIFTDYMKDKHDMLFTAAEEMNRLKKSVFAIMTEVSQNAPKSSTIHELNMTVLSAVKNLYLRSPSTTNENVPKKESKPNVKNLDRDRDIYGNREVTINEMIPRSNPYSKKSVPTMEDIISMREEKKEVPDITKLGKPITETAEGSEQFMKRLQMLESERTSVETTFRQTFQPPNISQNMERMFMDLETIQDPEKRDPKQMYQTLNEEQSELLTQKSLLGLEEAAFPQQRENGEDKIETSRAQLLIPRNGGGAIGGGNIGGSGRNVEIQKYISINSFDREWTSSHLRYQYGVSFGTNFQNDYKNIKSIEVGKVIIPEEIIENVNILNYPNKTNFNYEFSFSYPYLILKVDEFSDVYDGTNDNIRKGFCKLVYHRSYKAPNGRGYIVLKPLQKEKKTFISPLSALNRLSLSLLKPNGQLLNQSSDNYKIFKVDYEPFNPLYFNIVTDMFYDKNEFFVGDVVVFKGYSIPVDTVGISPPDVKQLVDFINRPEGHEIVQIGSTNDNGFYRSFYIYAPGSFNKQIGKYEVVDAMITCLNTYNNTINYATTTSTNGSILNFSLQNTIGMSIDVLVGDSSMIESSLV